MSTTAKQKSSTKIIQPVHHLLGILPLWMIQGEEQSDTGERRSAPPAPAEASNGTGEAIEREPEHHYGLTYPTMALPRTRPHTSAARAEKKQIVYYRKASVW